LLEESQIKDDDALPPENNKPFEIEPAKKDYHFFI
jgi:hypothetical protein